MWRLLVSITLALFVTFPVSFAAISLAIEGAQGKLPRNDPTMWPTIGGMAVLLVGSAVGSWRLFERWRATRPPRIERPGFLERFALANPGLFARAVSLNGFGLRYLDPHERQPDGCLTLTMWLTVAFFPVAPVRRERLRVLAPEKQGGVPLVVSWESTPIQPIERLPVERKRSRRVYLFYYAVLLPLLVAPLAAGFAWLVSTHFHITAWQLWTAALLYLAWGIGLIFYERRLMGAPARS